MIKVTDYIVVENASEYVEVVTNEETISNYIEIRDYRNIKNDGLCYPDIDVNDLQFPIIFRRLEDNENITIKFGENGKNVPLRFEETSLKQEMYIMKKIMRELLEQKSKIQNEIDCCFDFIIFGI